MNRKYVPQLIRPESVISRAADEIRRLIDARELGPGSALPPETELSVLLGISRNSVREAMRILDGLGFIEKRPGKQAVVRSRAGVMPNRTPHATDVAEAIQTAYEVRMVVEERCAHSLAERARNIDVLDLQRHLTRFEESVRKEDFRAASSAHQEFHHDLVKLTGNPLLAGMYESASLALAEYSSGIHETLANPQLPSRHQAIVDSIREGSPSRAVAAVRKHFQANRPTVQFRLRAEQLDGEGRPAATSG